MKARGLESSSTALGTGAYSPASMNSKSPAVSDRSAKLVLRASLGCAFTVGLVACGGADVQPVAPTTTKPVATAAAPVDVSEVPEPEGLAVVVRASNVDDTIKTAGSWAHIPLPKATDLVRSVSDDSLASVLDLSKPIDGAVVVQRNMKGILAAFSVAVSSVDAAKSKLESTYKVKPGSNGQFVVEGIGGTPSSHADASRAPTSDESDESDDDGLSCVLTPAPVGGRLVCGDSMVSVKALAPSLSGR